MNDCKPIKNATCHAKGSFQIPFPFVEVFCLSYIVVSLCIDLFFATIIHHKNKPIIAGTIHTNNEICQPNPTPSANGILGPEAIVANNVMEVVYKLVIIAT